MDNAVVTRESIRIKAQRDHARGVNLENCPFWETSEAAKTWREEWRRLEQDQKVMA